MNDQSDVPREYEAIPRDLLKHGTGRLSHVILVPQPSDSPNDPLNVRSIVAYSSRFVNQRLVVYLEERWHSSDRGTLRCGGWSVRADALSRVRPNCCRTRHQRQHTGTIYSMAHLDDWAVVVHCESTRESCK